jgi:putative ABC transport system permease protein
MEIRPILSALLKNTTAPLLVALQVAISLAILANAIYIVQTRLARAQRPSGISNEADVFAMDIKTIKKHSHQEKLAQQAQIRTHLRSLPGVLAAGTNNQLPMSRSGNINSISADPKQLSSMGASRYASGDSLLPTFGLNLIEGRDFAASDFVSGDPAVNRVGPKVIQVTRELARQLYPAAASVIGKPVYLGSKEDPEEVRIIGVVEQLQTISADTSVKDQGSIIYPYNDGESSFVVRSAPGQRDALIKQAEAMVRKLVQEPLIIDSETITHVRETRYQNDRTLAWMLIAISVFLLLITVSGIVGMSTVWVAERKKQIGVRRALGARKIDIVRYFVTENLLIGTAGTLLGCLLALALNQLLVSKLEMSTLPLPYLAAASVLLLLLGALSVLGPALRAAGISPAIATRSV